MFPQQRRTVNLSYLNIDAIELIETTPSAHLHQPREDAGHGLVIQSISAIDHETWQGQGLGQILGGFSFTGTSGTRR